MISLSDIVVTDICEVVTVPSPKGEALKMVNRCHYGLSFCTEGQITYTLNGVDYVSDPTHAIILPKGQSYTLHRDTNGSFALINFECIGFSSDTFCIIQTNNSDELMHDFEKLKSIFLFKRNKAKAMSILYDIIHKLSLSESVGPSILRPAIKYLESSYSSPEVSNGMLADMCNMSEVYFRRLFFRTFGMTPKKYILDARISKAKQLLSDGILKINAVSEECGFSSPYHFCRLFKEKTGLTPSEFMKKNKIYKI